MSIKPFGTGDTKLANLQAAGKQVETDVVAPTRASVALQREVNEAPVTLAGDVIGATTETAFVNFTIPGGTWPDRGKVTLQALLNEVTDNAADTGRVRVRVGPSTTALASRVGFWDSGAFDQDTAKAISVDIKLQLATDGSVSAWAHGWRESTGAILGDGALIAAAGTLDPLVDQVVSVTYESSSANAAQVMLLQYAEMVLLP